MMSASRRRLLLTGVAGVALNGVAHAQPSLPDPSRTPGALNPAVTQGNIGRTICVRGWTRSVRPPERFTYRLKRAQIHHWYRGGSRSCVQPLR